MRTQVSIALLVIGVVVGIGMGLTFAIVIPQITNSVAQQQISKILQENIEVKRDLNILSETLINLQNNNNEITQKIFNLEKGLPNSAEGLFASEVFDDVKPGVVSVTVIDSSNSPVAFGSGFVYSLDGYIITNSHVVETGDSYLLTFLDGSQVKASLVGNDPLGDIAVLQANLPKYAKAIELADSNMLKIGEPVFAIGSPSGLIGSITSGIVSQLNRTVPEYSFLFYIQTDAAINPGNSGGPLLSSEGKVAGINTWGFSKVEYEGLGFAIPSNIIKRVVPTLIQKNEYQYPLIGINGVFLDIIQIENLDIPETVESGWYITNIIEDSSAANSDLRKGDVILSINNYIVRYRHDINVILNQYFSSGETITLSVIRGDQTIAIDIMLGSR